MSLATRLSAGAGLHACVLMVGLGLGSPAASTDARGGVLRTGGIGVDGQPAADYRTGSVDVVAPGVDVSSPGITGTGSVTGSGTHYAVAFVAGATALVRTASKLSAEQAAHRVAVTADAMRDGSRPDGRYGWGFINPAAAVTKVLPEESDARPGPRAMTAAGSGTGRSRTILPMMVILLALGVSVLLVLRIRRMLGSDPGIGPDDGPGPDAPASPPPPRTAETTLTDAPPPSLVRSGRCGAPTRRRAYGCAASSGRSGRGRCS